MGEATISLTVDSLWQTINIFMALRGAMHEFINLSSETLIRKTSKIG